MSANLDTVKNRFGIIGHSPKLNSAIEIAIQVAPTEVTVLVNGENGTGKDVFSRIIHQFSKRKHQPFMAINCGAIPEGTMDSELFGHEKGSFTSAYESRKGYFEEVDGGTIFLDEIAEMPLQTQSRLLRLLENGEYLRVGSSKIRKANVRIIAATNKNLIDLIRKGKFREDLYFRLNTVSISVPPLRERGPDIELLFQWFAGEFTEKYRRSSLILTPDAVDLLEDYRWPGNVRELRNFVEKLSVLVEDEYVTGDLIRRYLPVNDSYLPVLSSEAGRQRPSEETTRDIEMLFKMMFELQSEVRGLKNLIYQGIQHPPAYGPEEDFIYDNAPPVVGSTRPLPQTASSSSPYGAHPPVTETPLLEESLSLAKKEKELIEKALRKYHNNRKKAATELGISERTLYRKIKHYELG